MGVLSDAYGDALRGDENTLLVSSVLGSVIFIVGTVAVVVFVVIVQCIPSNLREA